MVTTRCVCVLRCVPVYTSLSHRNHTSHWDSSLFVLVAHVAHVVAHVVALVALVALVVTAAHCLCSRRHMFQPFTGQKGCTKYLEQTSTPGKCISIGFSLFVFSFFYVCVRRVGDGKTPRDSSNMIRGQAAQRYTGNKGPQRKARFPTVLVQGTVSFVGDEQGLVQGHGHAGYQTTDT